MNYKEIENTIDEFLEIIDNKLFPANEKEFIKSLDNLALSTNYLNDIVFDETEYPDEPKLIYNEIREIINKKFPNHGYYNIPSKITEEIADAEIIVGDAIDDICDLYIDMKRIKWRFENTSQMDALWNFQFGYNSHWGWHLRDLQWYVFNLISDRDK
jgi:hypothetical protein